MQQKENQKIIKQGSIAVFALIVMFILAVATVGIITTATIERKTSISTGNSTTAFQVAESGMESALQLFKDNFDEQISNLGCNTKVISAPTSNNPSCSASIGYVLDSISASNDNEVRFKTNNQSVNCGYATCADYISNVRMIKSIGTTKQETRAIEEDVFLAATKLLLHLNGKNESGEFEDSSHYYNNHKPIDAQGDATGSSSEKKFDSGASVELDGSGDYLSVPDSDDWNFGTGNFTIDFWVRFKSLPVGSGNAAAIFSQHADDNNLMDIYLLNNGGSYQWAFNIKGGSINMGISVNTNNPPVIINRWYHIAYVRKGDQIKLFEDGILMGSVQNISPPAIMPSLSVVPVRIGSMNYGSGFYLNGYIDELRVSKGIARWWTSGFTVPTQEYTAD